MTNRQTTKTFKSSELYSDKISRGSRTYCFDIAENVNGELYLRISESKKSRNGAEQHRLMVFNEDIDDFALAFQNLSTHLKMLKKSRMSKVRSVQNVELPNQ